MLAVVVVVPVTCYMVISEFYSVFHALVVPSTTTAGVGS